MKSSHPAPNETSAPVAQPTQQSGVSQPNAAPQNATTPLGGGLGRSQASPGNEALGTAGQPAVTGREPHAVQPPPPQDRNLPLTEEGTNHPDTGLMATPLGPEAAKKFHEEGGVQKLIEKAKANGGAVSTTPQARPTQDDHGQKDQQGQGSNASTSRGNV